MFQVLCSLKFSSLKSFSATRHTPKVALYKIGASLRSVVYLQTLGVTQRGGVTAFHFLDLLFHMDNVSRHTWVASNLPRYITLLSTQTIVPPCGVYGQVSSKQILQNILQKSLLISIFHIYHKKISSAFQVSKQMFTCKRCKTEWLC